MECNKEEALRAKEMAENRMRDGDFSGAKKLVCRAQRIFPDLDNVSQLLAVCDVHCSAQNLIMGTHKNWYAILQVESFADETIIKKQYRKLALLLHPDKNNFPGAEGAFKLIGEANGVLTDLTKRSDFDLKCGATLRTYVSKPQQSQRNSSVKKHCGAATDVPKGPKHHGVSKNVPCPQFTGSNPSKTEQKMTFWTRCLCGTTYKFSRDFVNKVVPCQNCQGSFIAYDLGTSAVPPGNQKSGSMHAKESVRTPKPGVASGKKGVGNSWPDLGKHGKSTTSTNASKKRKSNSVDDESSESCTSETHSEEEDVEIKESEPEVKRSSRKKQNVSYDENSTVLGGVFTDDKSSIHCEESLPKGKEAERSGHDDSKSNVNNDNSDSDSDSDCAQSLQYPDPEFNDFDKDKTEQCFAVNQVWALYDTRDGMPRFYAQIKKVFTPMFKLRITWLEPDPDDEIENEWCEADLPVGCGKFVKGSSIQTEDRLMFSHQTMWKKGVGKGSCLVYPKRGETWAVFSDWDIKWSFDPEMHKPPYRYEYVEVLTDFVENHGIQVAYLDKVKGFISLFQRRVRDGIITPVELYRLSHRIPSFRMTGKEREGVPAGCFELDPACLPDTIFEPDVVKMENESCGSKARSRK